MSNNNDFLKSAIADAKLVKEAAMMNAKKAIEESFAPHIKSMLSTRIQEMDEEEASSTPDVQSYLSDLGTPEEIAAYLEGNSADEDPEKADWTEDDYREDFKFYIHDKMDSASLDESSIEEEDFNLEELLDEMSTESLNESEELEENEDISEVKKEEDDEPADATDDESDDETEDDGDEDPEIDLDNLSEDDLKTFIEDVIASMVEDGELEAGEGSEEGDEEIDFDLENGVEDEVEAEDDSLELAEVKTQLDESIKMVEKLRNKINEVNLLNSKLLYTNKIYKSKTLNEEKKNKVLEAFDKANTVKEVKLTYSILNESSSASTKKLNTPVRGFASQASIIKENKTITPILEDDDMFKRMQKLAGLS